MIKSMVKKLKNMFSKKEEEYEFIVGSGFDGHSIYMYCKKSGKSKEVSEKYASFQSCQKEVDKLNANI